MAIECDVAVIGGGPAASTLGTLLRKHDPKLRVALIEREVFPREHVGESMLLQLVPVLHEMDVWDKVEAAGFPVKVGSLFKWGASPELWSLNFLFGEYRDVPRPSKFEGQRTSTSFQVDRGQYDKILLDHAKDHGCMVYEGVKVASVDKDGDRVIGLKVMATNSHGETALGGETEFRARWYVDASGNSGLLRRTMGVEVDSPTALRNIAIYDYWQNAEWAERIGEWGTRTLVLSIDYGWLWFIQIGSSRTSVGLVVPADYAKKSGKRPEEMYIEAVRAEPTIARLLANATRENITRSTKDWSFVADRIVGENWFLSGDAAGFADPILSAGLTLAQTGSRNLAYTILELNRGEVDAGWLKECYQQSQTARIRNHIRFADYWYSANGAFIELKEYCAEISQAAGVKLGPEEAWAWMGQGGFTNDGLHYPGVGGKGIGAVKGSILAMAGAHPGWEVQKFNRFLLNVEGAKPELAPSYWEGRVAQIPCLRRGSFILPATGAFFMMAAALQDERDLPALMNRFVFHARASGETSSYEDVFELGIETLEAMVVEGWARGEVSPSAPRLGIYYRRRRPKFGWLQEGVGLTSVNPNSPTKMVVSWAEFQQLRNA